MGSAITAWLAAILMAIGALFMLVAAFGVWRMPDVYTRMQASTKSSTLGAACMLLAVAVHFGTLGVTTQAFLVVLFFFLTAPVAAHMIARAAYLGGVPLWENTVVNDLQGRYDTQTQTLNSPPATSPVSPEHSAADSQATEP